MEATKKVIRKNYSLDEDVVEKLTDLAEENSGGNLSLMIRKLVEVAYRNPKAIRLHPPKSDAPVELVMN